MQTGEAGERPRKLSPQLGEFGLKLLIAVDVIGLHLDPPRLAGLLQVVDHRL